MQRFSSRTEKILDYLRQLAKPWKPEVRKALVGGVVAAGGYLLAQVGVTPEMTVEVVLEGAGAWVSGYFLTWLFPNE